MSKDISCPSCRRSYKETTGFFHDADKNLVCLSCKSVIFAVTEQAELETKKKVDPIQKKEVVPIIA